MKDSPIAERYAEGLAERYTRTGGGEPSQRARPRTGPVRAVVIHTTGGGVVDRVDGHPRFRAWNAKHPHITTPFQAAEWVYTAASPYSGHYLVGQGGEVVQVIHENLVAMHVGGRGSRVYRLPRAVWARSSDYDWWRERWSGLRSPRDLAGGQLWEGGSCNAQTIGIEVAPPIEDPRAPWSDRCWESLGMLVWDITVRHGIPCTRENVVTHSDAHHRARTSRGRPWDPPPRQWSWERFASRLGAPW